MDLNYLLHRHQISVMRAGAASCAPSRRAHLGLADLYAEAIARLRETLGAEAWAEPALSAR